MRLEKSLSFRRNPVPWYDTKPACLFMVALMIFVFLFALIGIRVAIEDMAPPGSIWVPLALATLSAGVFLSILLRMLRRYLTNRSG